MAKLLTNATDDAESSAIVATGPVLVTVTGTLPVGIVIITADIGGGEITAYMHKAGDPTSLARLEFTAGVTFKAYLKGVNGNAGVNINVDYIYVV